MVLFENCGENTAWNRMQDKEKEIYIQSNKLKISMQVKNSINGEGDKFIQSIIEIYLVNFWNVFKLLLYKSEGKN